MVLAVVYGGATEGSYLCNHPGIEEIHITGSDKTFDAIVFGAGSEGIKRKAEGSPLLTKRVTGELGNVSPVIVVPGPWKPDDLIYQAEHIDTMLTNNAGFNCNATRVIIQDASWPLRSQLLEECVGFSPSFLHAQLIIREHLNDTRHLSKSIQKLNKLVSPQGNNFRGL